METSIVYDFGIVEVHNTYIKAVMHEAITVLPKHNDALVELAENYFSNKTFGYISHRLNSYSVDPRVYLETSKIPNLAAFALVSENPVNLSNAQVEQLFLNKPFKTFKKLEKSIAWVEKTIDQ